MGTSTFMEDKLAAPRMAASGGAGMPGPDDDVDSWPWWLKIRGLPGVIERERIASRAHLVATAIVSAITVDAIARSAGSSGEALAKSAQATLADYGDWVCGNDLTWLLRLFKKLKDYGPIPHPHPLPDPPPPWATAGLQSLEVINELITIRTSMPAKSAVGLGVEKFVDGLVQRIEGTPSRTG